MLKTYLLLLFSLSLLHCQSQEQTTIAQPPLRAAKPAPLIVGTPPPFVNNAGPFSDSTLVGQYIRTIFQDSKGYYWFGPAGQSVARYNGSTLRYFSRNEFFHGNTHIERKEGNSVQAIEEDSKGNIWFGTYLGLVKYNGETFRSYDEKDGLGHLSIGRQCILNDSKNRLWVGTYEGVYLHDPAAGSDSFFTKAEVFPNCDVKGIMEDRDGNIWVATGGQGIFKWDGKSLTILNDKLALGNNYAGGMAQDADGNYWFTTKWGICKYDGNTFTEITSKDGLGGSETWGLYLETSGIIWVTARGSTTRFDPSLPLNDPKAFTIFTPEEGLNCCVQSMYEDRDGNMWWGTGQGLYRFDGNKFYQVKQVGPW